VPTAERSKVIQVGAGWPIANADYSPNKIQGFSIYGTHDFARHWPGYPPNRLTPKVSSFGAAYAFR
jgi:hypothetical protein